MVLILLQKNALEYIEKNPEVLDELKYVAARACYDAALQNNYDQQWFSKSVEMAQKYLLTSDSKLIEAEGYHFIALCMTTQE